MNDKMVSIVAVKSANQVQVNHIGNHKELYIQKYFEENVMKDCPIKIRSVKLTGQSAIIEFDNIQSECFHKTFHSCLNAYFFPSELSSQPYMITLYCLFTNN